MGSAGNQGLSRDVNADWEADGGLPNIRGRDITPWGIAIQSKTAIDFCNKNLWCVALSEESSRPCTRLGGRSIELRLFRTARGLEEARI